MPVTYEKENLNKKRKVGKKKRGRREDCIAPRHLCLLHFDSFNKGVNELLVPIF